MSSVRGNGRGAIPAGFVKRGSHPLGERTGSGGSDLISGGWVAFRIRRGPPCLERMYYDRASASRLFRTHFLNCPSGVADASEAGRSHSPSDIAQIVPIDGEIPYLSTKTPPWSPCEIVYQEIRVDPLIGLLIVPSRH